MLNNISLNFYKVMLIYRLKMNSSGPRAKRDCHVDVFCSARLKANLRLCYTLGNSACNLSRNFVTPLPHKLHQTLRSVTCPEMNLSRNGFCNHHHTK